MKNEQLNEIIWEALIHQMASSRLPEKYLGRITDITIEGDMIYVGLQAVDHSLLIITKQFLLDYDKASLN